MTDYDVTPEGIAGRKALGLGPRPEKKGGLTLGEKVQLFYWCGVAGAFLVAIFVCNFLLKLVFAGFALR